MTAIEEFETLLKDVVNAKRLSASKMNALTDIALKNIEHDTQLVSILYRTHKSLTSVTTKIFSLYIFDALCRAAKSHSAKHNVSGDATTQPGNTATFLLKVAGVVEGLFQDMISSGSQEAKEKSKKIYDIWVKGNTFPATILAQLAEILKGPEQVPLSKSVTPPAAPANQPTTDPRISALSAPTLTTQASTIQASPVVPVVDPQAALLALLTQAAASATQTSMPHPPLNAGAGAPQLGAAQLAVLQQLAHTAAPVTTVPQSLTPADLVNVQKYPSSSGLNGSSRPPEPLTKFRHEQRYNGYRSPEHESRTNPHFDDRDSSRGRYRGGFRGRGRGGRNWDERDHRYRDSEKDNQSPPQPFRGGRSRSRSPLRNGDRRVTRFGSPPRRAREPSPPSTLSRVVVSAGRQPEAGKDEFGRDIRSESPVDSPTTSQKTPPAPRSPLQSTTKSDPRKLIPSAGPSTTTPIHPQHSTSHSASIPNSVPHVDTSNTFSNANSTQNAESVSSAVGLESFNLAMFDYTAPASWEGLAKMWQVTNGTFPTQERLLEFVMQCTINGGQPVLQPTPQSNAQSFQSQEQGAAMSFRGRGRGRGGSFRGRGGASYGNGTSNYQNDWDYDNGGQNTDAIVLGGDDNAATAGGGQIMFDGIQGTLPTAQEGQLATPVGSSGKMQKVGGKWVFVRGTAMDVS